MGLPYDTLFERRGEKRMRKAMMGLILLLTCSAFAGSAGAQVILPAGSHVFLTTFGDGVQIYDSASNGAGGFQWVFTAPQANLFTDSTETTLLGTHFAGPTWQYNVDGSTVVGMRVSSNPSPNPNSI